MVNCHEHTKVNPCIFVITVSNLRSVNFKILKENILNRSNKLKLLFLSPPISVLYPSVASRLLYCEVEGKAQRPASSFSPAFRIYGCASDAAL